MVIALVALSGIYKCIEGYDVSVETAEFDFKACKKYVISLKHADDRRQVLAANIPYTVDIFDAVDGHSLDENEVQPFTSLSRGQIGCFMSHIRLWERIAGEDASTVCIFEDDVVVSDDQAASNLRLPVDADLMFLGHCAEPVGEKVVGQERLHTSVYPRCTHAYLITKNAAKRLSEYMRSNQHTMPIDEILAQLINSGFVRAYSYHPALAQTSGQQSYIHR